MKKHSIIFITHKMKEVMALSHRITVLSRGKVMATLKKDETNPQELADLMISNLEAKDLVKSFLNFYGIQLLKKKMGMVQFLKSKRKSLVI